VPGHDPEVLERYPRWRESPHVAALHLPPREP